MFQINSVTVSAFDVSSSYITANWNISFSVKNPNMAVSLHYEDVRVLVLYNGVHLLSANIPQFHQSSLEETSVQANVTVTSVSINKSVAKAIAVARGNGYLDFTVTIDGSIRIVFSIRKEKRSKIRVSCEDLKSRILYEHVKASIFYKDASLSSMDIMPFYKFDDDTGSLEVNMTSSSVSMNNSIADDIAVDWSHGAVNFTITLNGIIRINIRRVRDKPMKMRVFCKDVEVRFYSNTTVGTMFGKAEECKVHSKF
ncbi:hypothetical protein F0562_001623 [Nyssa sinensis]|uniref:Late embryogenesis abundant protein LEA-2 subgroup domain-containing protein n=1 Tax=Nyssa sinensis TaxID=561372 RepID=A0A5J5C472_9ASTE|nr:hypothetical protein F0562_001623 [Nyssa sinensis]